MIGKSELFIMQLTIHFFLSQFERIGPISANWRVSDWLAAIGCLRIVRVGLCRSGRRFAKKEQWERWRAKRKSVSGSKHQVRFCRSPGISPDQNVWILCMQNPAI